MGLFAEVKNVFGFAPVTDTERINRLAENPAGREVAEALSNSQYSADAIQALHKNYLSGNGSMLDVYSAWGGDKYQGQFGLTKDLNTLDMYTLRMRSRQLYRENAIVAAMLRRMETKILTTGLQLEADPIPEILEDTSGMDEDELVDWAVRTEALYKVYMQNPNLIDYHGVDTSAELQKKLWRMATLDGVALVIVRYKNGNPNVQIVAGSSMVNPENAAELNVRYGTRYSADGKEEIGYFVKSSALKNRNSVYSDGINELVYIPRKTPRGRLNAWRFFSPYGLVGDDVPAPLLSVILASLKETDRYIDNEQRAKALSASLVWFMGRENAGPAMTGLGEGAVATQSYFNSVASQDSNSTRESKDFSWSESTPGMSMSYLQPGEKPHIFETNGRDTGQFVDFVTFNMDLMSASLNLPPEMLLMKYGKNFSASRQVKIDFNSYKDVETQRIAAMFNNPLYEIWLLTQIFQGRIEAPGYYEAWRTRAKNWDIYGAWNNAQWQGQVEEAIEPSKFITAMEKVAELDFMDEGMIARKYYGTNIQKNIRRNKKLAAMRAEGAVEVEGDGTLDGVVKDISKKIVKNTLQSLEREVDLENGE